MPERVVEPARLAVLGVPVSAFDSYEHAVAWIGERIERRASTFCAAINPEKIDRANRDPELRQVLTAADAGLCDGIGVAMAAWLLHGRRIARCTGCDLFSRLVGEAEARGWSVFLLGASGQSNRGAAEALLRLHPALKIAGQRDGYFDNPPAVIQQINDSGADLLFVALGSPGQELFIHRYRPAIEPPLMMGVGGSFDVLSGAARRAPAAFRKTGTEFLYRLLSDPARWRRQLALPRFAIRVLAERLKRSGPFEEIP
jgi:N-acetylglucosaminyldiphosphoundecaprenol N-acetyl-beta-D-mannosaminyltransferase